MLHIHAYTIYHTFTGEKGEMGENGTYHHKRYNIIVHTQPVVVTFCLTYTGSSLGGGSTYIRWGRNTCDKGEVVYNGVAVARQGSNPICLPNYDQSNDDVSMKNVPPVFDFDMPTRANIEGESQNLSLVGVRHDNNIQSRLLCALCFLPNLPAPTLIVGTHLCPKVGVWRLEYYGQLVTTASDYICLDLERGLRIQRPEGDVDLGTTSSFAYLTQPVKADCQGSMLSCTGGRRFEEIPCAVCTRVS